jgi:hypothetical protein
MEAFRTMDMENRIYTWNISIIIPKIPNDAKINLTVNEIERN